MKMDEQEYRDKLKVRSQLSLADKFRVLEHEFVILTEKVGELEGRMDGLIAGINPKETIEE